MAHNNTLSLVALAVAAGLASPVFATNKQADEVMVVSGSRMEQRLEDVSGPISVITAEQIEEQVVSNVADLFRYEPGVTVLGGAGDAQTFIIRGMGENRVKIVRDGVRQNDAYKNGGVGQSYFDTDMIKQIEVAKGPASAAYGSDALGGVIVITTKDAGDFLKGRDSYLDATTGYASSSHQNMAGFTGALRSGEFENLLRYTWRDGGVTQNYDSDKSEFDIVSQAVLFKSQWHLSEDQFLKLTADYFSEGQDPDAVDLTKVASVFNQPITDKDTDNLSLVLDHGITLNAPWVDRMTASSTTPVPSRPWISSPPPSTRSSRPTLM